MAKKKKRPVSGRSRMRSPIFGYNWMFVPLYGPWAAISTAHPTQQDPADHPAYPGEGGINSGDVPAGTNSGMGPMESEVKSLSVLTEGLAHMSNVLGAGMSDEAITSMFFDEMPLADPDGSEDPVAFDVPADLVGLEPEVATPMVATALTGVMHKAFSKAADDMMIAGYLSQDQRIALSGCVSVALKAFTASLETNCPWSFEQPIDDDLAGSFMEGESDPDRLLSALVDHAVYDVTKKSPKIQRKGNDLTVVMASPDEAKAVVDQATKLTTQPSYPQLRGKFKATVKGSTVTFWLTA